MCYCPDEEKRIIAYRPMSDREKMRVLTTGTVDAKVGGTKINDDVLAVKSY